MRETENPLVLSFTNKAIENVKARLTNNLYEKRNANKIYFTFDSEWKGRDLKSLEDKTIFIEEFSMVQNKWMTLIYKALTMFNNKIFMFEDPNQREPVESNSQRRYNFLESKTVNEMCPKRKNLEYIESGCRYDIKIHEMSDKFLKTGQISTYFSYKYYKNL